MIGALFTFRGESVEVRIVDSTCYFRTSQFGSGFVNIEGLKLDKKGVIKEHPDLKERDDWREEAIIRFKDKIKNFNNEMEQIKYIINDLKKFGYMPICIQRTGFRPQRVI